MDFRLLGTALLLSATLPGVSPSAFQRDVFAQPSTITIRADNLLDGRGGMVRNVVIRVDGGHITSVAPSNERATYTLFRAVGERPRVSAHVRRKKRSLGMKLCG